jgi:hypothetical protein
VWEVERHRSVRVVQASRWPSRETGDLSTVFGSVCARQFQAPSEVASGVQQAQPDEEAASGSCTPTRSPRFRRCVQGGTPVCRLRQTLPGSSARSGSRQRAQGACCLIDGRFRVSFRTHRSRAAEVRSRVRLLPSHSDGKTWREQSASYYDSWSVSDRRRPSVNRQRCDKIRKERPVDFASLSPGNSMRRGRCV